KLLILPLASKALELQSFEAFKAASRIKSVPPLKRRVTFFCLKQQKSVWIPFGQKVTKEKCFSLNQGPARAVLTRAYATRDIHVPVAHGVHPARRPSGVLLLTRVTNLAALGMKPDLR
ncbi:hypothetical protein, partial [Lysobacter capsici]|uniref:hypothetical protein n=1 Tax=Lysobacter capsici TaxID=435897 RepID=UPI00398CB11A